MDTRLLIALAAGLLGTVVTLLFVGVAPGQRFPELDGNQDTFVMYLPDESSCVKADPNSGRLFLSDCTETDIWAFVAGLLREQNSGECLTAIHTKQVLAFETLVLQLRMQVQGRAALNLTDEDTAAIGLGLAAPQPLFGMMNTNVSVRLAPCWDSLSHAGAAAANWSKAMRDAQTWSLAGPDIVKEGWESGCLTVGPGIFGMSTWVGDQRDNSSSRLTDCFMTDLSMVLQLRPCRDPDRLCGGRGTLLKGHSCSCDCSSLWAGRLCHEPSANATQEELSCSEAKELGPAGDWDLGHQWLQLRFHLFKLCRLPIIMAKGFTYLGLIAEVVLACIGIIVCAGLAISGGDLRTSLCPFLCLLVLPAFLLVAVPALTCIVLILFSLAIVAYYMYLAVIFPIYAKVNAGRWPHADRAILFCMGETAFSTYVFVPYCFMITLGLMDTAKMIFSVPNLLDQNKILSVSMPFTNADKIVGQELFNVVPLTGLFFELLSRSALQKLSGVYLLLMQLAEVVMLWLARKNTALFFRYEFIFAMCQDLPQFLLSAVLVLKKSGDAGGIDQFEVYGLATGCSALLVQLARAVHGSLSPAGNAAAEAEADEQTMLKTLEVE